MKDVVEVWIELKIVNDETGEILYAGNYDEVTSCSILGFGNGRFGEEQGLENNKEFSRKFENCNTGFGWESFPHDEYGMVAYSLGEINCDYVRFKTEFDNSYSPKDEKVFWDAVDNWKLKVKGYVFKDQGYDYEGAPEPINIRVEDVFVVVKTIKTEIRK